MFKFCYVQVLRSNAVSRILLVSVHGEGGIWRQYARVFAGG